MRWNDDEESRAETCTLSTLSTTTRMMTATSDVDDDDDKTRASTQCSETGEDDSTEETSMRSQSIQSRSTNTKSEASSFTASKKIGEEIISQVSSHSSEYEDSINDDSTLSTKSSHFNIQLSFD